MSVYSPLSVTINHFFKGPPPRTLRDTSMITPGRHSRKQSAQHPSIFAILYLKGLSHEIDFKKFDENVQNLAQVRDAAGF